jgi:hypothetical protein
MGKAFIGYLTIKKIEITLNPTVQQPYKTSQITKPHLNQPTDPQTPNPLIHPTPPLKNNLPPNKKALTPHQLKQPPQSKNLIPKPNSSHPN